MSEILNLWEGFKEVVKFIDNNKVWLDALMGDYYLYKTKFYYYGKYREVTIVRGPQGQNSVE